MAANNVLNISDEQGQLLLDIITRTNKNEERFLYSDFIFKNITPIEPMADGQNTKITLEPKVESGYYNTKDFYYRRMDFSFLDTTRVTIHPGLATKLSQLIDDINTKYGVRITSSDYYDADIVTDPATGRKSVKIQARPESLLFIGTHTLQLGGQEDYLVDDDNVERRYYVFTKDNDILDVKKTVVCVDGDGQTINTFSFLSNTENITTFNPTQMFLIKEPVMVLVGTFVFTYYKNGQKYSANASTVFIDSITGVVTDAIAEKRFGDGFELDYVVHRRYNGVAVPYQYVIDRKSQLGSNPAGLYRYDHLGQLDKRFVVSGIAYRPDTVSVSVDGSLYVATPVYTTESNPNRNVSVDRLLPDGSLDTVFHRITMRSFNLNDTLQVATMYPIVVDGVDQGMWMLLNPVYGVSGLKCNQLMNETYIVPANETENYAWNPIFRIGRDGSWVKSFDNRLLNNMDKSIYMPVGSNMLNGRDSIAGNSSRVCFFTHRANPATGFDHRAPLLFSDTGKMTLINGINYALQYYWVTANHILRQSNDYIVSFGQVYPAHVNGGWGDEIDIVARMYPDGRNHKVLYKSSPVATGSKARINSVVLIEKPGVAVNG